MKTEAWWTPPDNDRKVVRSCVEKWIPRVYNLRRQNGRDKNSQETECYMEKEHIKKRAYDREDWCHWRPGPLWQGTRDSGLLLTFDIPEGDQVSSFSSVIWLTWRRLLRWSADVCIELCNSLNLDFCKVLPQLCDGSTLIHDICSSSTRKDYYNLQSSYCY